MNDDAFKNNRGRRQDNIIYVRATPDEKTKIQNQASASSLSASRFLVQAALEEKRPATEEERREREKLLYLFHRARLHLEQLLSNTRAMRLTGANEEMEKHLEETAHLLAALSDVLRKRL